MDSLHRVRTISRVFRYLVICIGAVITGAAGIALGVSGQDWLSVGDERLADLLNTGAINGVSAALLMAPVGVIFILGIYWLQRLFGAYAAGSFFTDESMRCYLWLVWLKVASFAYHLVLPLLFSWTAQTDGENDANIIVDVGALVELMVLLLIVHLMREAQRINEENKGFV
ncbi:MAG: DUF2975 domain-containing protein [Halioglobus sp.]